MKMILLSAHNLLEQKMHPATCIPHIKNSCHRYQPWWRVSVCGLWSPCQAGLLQNLCLCPSGIVFHLQHGLARIPPNEECQQGDAQQCIQQYLACMSSLSYQGREDENQSDAPSLNRYHAWPHKMQVTDDKHPSLPTVICSQHSQMFPSKGKNKNMDPALLRLDRDALPALMGCTLVWWEKAVHQLCANLNSIHLLAIKPYWISTELIKPKVLLCHFSP